jgi:hypothetical protein
MAAAEFQVLIGGTTRCWQREREEEEEQRQEQERMRSGRWRAA